MARRKFNALKCLMYERETTQDELAERMGRSKTYVNRRLTAKEPFDTEDIKFIATELAIPKTEWIDLFFEGVS